MTDIEGLDRLIHYFNRLPGIGKKTAQRLAFYVLKSDKRFSEEFSAVLKDIKSVVKFCERCGHLSTESLCSICSNHKRNPHVICVVADFSDIFAIEKTHEYSGLYHVLGGVLSPLDSIGPEQLNIKSLMNRMQSEEIKEIILALTSTTEGEATVTYLSKLIEPNEIKITRIARGVPLGTELEYLDHATLGRAIQGRSNL